MSRSPIKAISSALQRIWPLLNPVEAPAPVRRASQPAPKVDFRLGALAQRTSVSTSMAGRTGVLPKVAMHRPAGGAAIHPRVPPQPRHSLGSQVWGQGAERNKALGAPWAGPLERHATPLGAEVWNSAQIARVPPATKPLRQMSNTALQQRRDALVLALKAHDMSSRGFEKAHGHREFGHEILNQEMAGYQREIGRIDSLQAQRARRR